jgi:hypothetical protein
MNSVYVRVTFMLPATRQLLAIMPFLFGIGFIAPAIAQLMEHAGIGGVWGMSRVSCGLELGATWGGIANWRGRWL